ncbi:hypothetical protein [Haloglomus salinum]|uniref:hypothetical protein n=1 Tax=Haloglomus salinum TaxID=2962673 RepID=UPI0020C99E4C|nr:hypothetical protein [Haloglomus salinum]
MMGGWNALVTLLVLSLLVPAGAVAVTDPATAAASATTAATTDPGLVDVQVEPRRDPDGDGRYGEFVVTVVADTRMPDTDVLGNNPGEPYLEIEVDGEDVHETDIVERRSEYRLAVTLDESELGGIETGDHDLTVELWDADQDRDDTDLGNDDQVDSRTVDIGYETPAALAVSAARSETVVGSPVAFRTPPTYDAPTRWTLVDAPPGSDATLRTYDRGTATLRPDATGPYRIRVTSGGETATTTLRATSADRVQALRRYAPRIHYAAEEPYQPTRYEALVYNAELQDIAHPNVEEPTLFDIAGRSDDWELDMPADEREFPTYDDRFPPTVYGSVHEGVTYRGETYTAYTYWLFYVYDPKQPDSIGAIVAHQSDLETVSVLVNESGPQWVAASQHYGGEVREWAKTGHTGHHADIYPAFGAHSNYLRNTERYGAGIPIQDQFIDKESRKTVIPDVAEGVYADRTGNARNLTHDGSLGEAYQVVPLTGEEVWASYAGAMGPDDETGQVPYQRTRYTDLEDWLTTFPVPDERQVDGNLSVAALEAGEAVAAEARLENTGPKPHTYWLVLEAVPEQADREVRRLDATAVPLATDATATRELTGTPPDPSGNWSLRVRALAYPPGVADLEDVLTAVERRGALVVRESGAVVLESTPTPASGDGRTSTSAGPLGAVGPGFGPGAAVVALVLALAGLVASGRWGERG